MADLMGDPGGVMPGRDLSRDISKGEAVEVELDSMIRRRHDARVIEEGERPAEEAWQESERRHEAERQRALAFAWMHYHQRLIGQRRMSSLLEAHHKSEIARYQEILGLHVYGNG